MPERNSSMESKEIFASSDEHIANLIESNQAFSVGSILVTLKSLLAKLNDTPIGPDGGGSAGSKGLFVKLPPNEPDH